MSDPFKCLDADNDYAKATRQYLAVTQEGSALHDAIKTAYQMGYMHGVLDGLDDADAAVSRSLRVATSTRGAGKEKE